jgi:hypothetical protein
VDIVKLAGEKNREEQKQILRPILWS